MQCCVWAPVIAWRARQAQNPSAYLQVERYRPHHIGSVPAHVHSKVAPVAHSLTALSPLSVQFFEVDLPSASKRKQALVK